ncbi:HAD family hydrolase [Planococcus lenghuensis]|uniref:HAD family hydrolase n=1 Tax=Planococcus lenghuensis TaxID=2213202 RepID=A0A1Q2L283_9BACL|nr:HAD family hydrolase [Planococcus lenghuensis]AQQ54570.1 HAD family hydrolase [Planococcus lenghuensis]
MIKGVVFDFDGLIIDTEVAWFEAYKEVVASYGADLPLARFAECVGTTDDVLYGVFRELIGNRAGFEEIEAQAARLVDEKMKNPVAREGVADYLAEAKRQGYRVALATSSSRAWATHFLTALGLMSYFEVLVTRDDVERVKPAPELYVKAVEALGLQSEQAIAFEDSVNGCKAAVSAGLDCVIVPSVVTADLPFEGYVLRLNSMAERSFSDVIDELKERANPNW